MRFLSRGKVSSCAMSPANRKGKKPEIERENNDVNI